MFQNHFCLPMIWDFFIIFATNHFLMKTILIEIDDKVYNDFKKFLKILPKESFKVLGDDIDELTLKESKEVYRLKEKVSKGDFSEFVNWDEIKEKL